MLFRTMNTNEIVTALDTEIARLTQIRDLLGEVNGGSANGRSSSDAAIHASSRTTQSSERKRPGRPKGSKNKSTSFNPEEFAPKRRTMSAAGKERIAAAQRARWARQKGAVALKKERPVAAKAVAAKSSGAKLAGKKTSAPAKKPTAKPLAQSAASLKPTPARKAIEKTKSAKKVTGKSAAKTPVKKPGTQKRVQVKPKASPSPASANPAGEETVTAAAE